jgi:glycyl-tRNA synthetase alpha subunit
MICTLMDFWAEKNSILSPTQYGFRKGKGTQDCLAMLTTDISKSFEMKKQTGGFSGYKRGVRLCSH